MAEILITLPPLGEYPANGTDAAKDQWLRMADLYVRRAHTAVAQAQADNAAAIPAAMAAAFAPSIDKIVAQWAAHDGAMDRLTAAISGPFEVGGAGVSSADFVAILTALLKALAVK